MGVNGREKYSEQAWSLVENRPEIKQQVQDLKTLIPRSRYIQQLFFSQTNQTPKLLKINVLCESLWGKAVTFRILLTPSKSAGPLLKPNSWWAVIPSPRPGNHPQYQLLFLCLMKLTSATMENRNRNSIIVILGPNSILHASRFIYVHMTLESWGYWLLKDFNNEFQAITAKPTDRQLQS